MILLTGATGLLGAHLLRVGLDHGYRFRALSRSVPDRSFLATVAAKVDIVASDLTTDPLGDDLFAGVDVIVHAAALASPFPVDEDKMMALNVGATRRLFERAVALGVRKWVQVSSVATLSGSGAIPITEAVEEPRDTMYARTKWLADQYLRSEAHRLPVLTIHPTFILGPWDARPSSGGVLLALRMRRLRHYVECVKNVVGAADVATGIFQALEREVTGHYLLGGSDVMMSSFLRAATDLLGMQDALTELPALPAAPTEVVKDPELQILRELCTPSPSSVAKAAKDFGYAPAARMESLLAETVAYFTQHRLLPRMRRAEERR